MNKKQYNNIIVNTLKHQHTEDSLSAARAVFKNMGVALPGGDMKEVFETVKTDNYMGWKSCTMEEAQAAANNGTAAIGISDSKIVVLAADDAEEPIEPTVEVLAITDTTPAVAVAGLQYYSYSYGGTGCGGCSTIYPPYIPEYIIPDKPYDPYYPYTNIRTSEQYYSTLNTYSYELRNEIVFNFTFEEINSLSMYLNLLTYKNSTQQEKEQVVKDAISIGKTVISIGVNFVPVVGNYLSGVLTGIDVVNTVNGLNKSTAEENIKDIISCINAFSHYKNGMQSLPKPSCVTYTISLLKKDPLYGREIKIESSDGLRDIYTLENSAYDTLVATATANAHRCSMYKIAPKYTYYWENFNVNTQLTQQIMLMF